MVSIQELGLSGAGRRAEVIGAGFAGLTAATALSQLGWSVRLHEQAAELREQGAGIVLWNNSLQVLDAIGVLDRLKERSATPPFYETRKHHLTQSKESFPGIDWRTVTRPYLHTCLLSAAKAAGVEIVAGSEAIGASPDGLVRFADGSEVTADLVVGADGVKSQVRDSLKFEQQRHKSRDGITRFLIPRLRTELGGQDDWDNVIDFWNIEPRYLRVLYVPCNDEELYIALGAPRSDEDGSRTPIDLDLWSLVYPELIPALKAASIASDPKYYGYQTTMLERWTNGRVALIGDAAHAMGPALAQGAGCAMQNAYTLSIAATEAASKDLPDALEVWDSLERPVTQRVQRQSGEYADDRSMSLGNQFTDEKLVTARYNPTDPRRHDKGQ